MRWMVAMAIVGALITAAGSVSVAAADAQCQAWCAQTEAECSRSVRESRKACAQKAATAGVDPLTRQREDTTYLCGWFRGNNCSGRWAGANCAQRQRARLDLCLDAYAPNTTAEYLACGEGERQALALCRAEMSDCQAQCN